MVSDSPFLSPTTLGAAFVVFLALKWLSRRQSLKQYPPGPPKLPLIGNLLDMPTKLDTAVFSRMAREYNSDVIHLGALGQSLVILNSLKACEDLLDKRSSIYSSRPNSVMVRELCGFKWSLALRPYDDHWRIQRKSHVKYLEATRHIFEERELFYARSLLQHLLEQPDKFMDHILYAVGSVIMSATYGFKIGANDPYIALAGEMVETVTNCVSSGIYLPDIIPAAQHLPSWLPGLKFPKLAEESSRVTFDFVNKPFEDARKKMLSGELLPSVVQVGLENVQDNPGELKALKELAASFYLGGVDTSAAVLYFLVFALVKHPEVLQKIQQELDQVLQGRLPNHKDFQYLPYLTAAVLETYRWRPISPFGLPHSIIADDVYRGYFIPKDSTVLVNMDFLLHDENTYPEPDVFRPERFLTDGKLDDSTVNPIDILFGFGRRVCIGRERAHSTIMIYAAWILSTFTIEKKRDSKGALIEPIEGVLEGVARFPLPFECSIKPRSAAAAALIKAYVASADTD